MDSLKFGTSGLRGLAVELEGPSAARYASAFGQYLLNSGLVKNGADILISRDFRDSSAGIAAICTAALMRSGFNVLDCGTIPTPALALIGLERSAASLMITGSHIPADQNGIKFYRPDGEIDKNDELSISNLAGDAIAVGEPLLSDSAVATDVSSQAANSYVSRNKTILGARRLAGVKVGVFQHSSVARDLLVEVLSHYGAQVLELGRSHSFVPVDTEAVWPQIIARLKEWAGEHQLDAIVSADADGDRPLVADETGQPLRGDLLGLITAEFLGADVVVTPVTSNSGIERATTAEVHRTNVGSPFVIAAMTAAGRSVATKVVGFEANGGCLTGTDFNVNGHILRALLTRDSFLPVLAVLNKMVTTNEPLSKVAASYRLPFAISDRLQNFPVENSTALMAYLRASGKNLASFLAPIGAPQSVSDIDGLRVTLADDRIIHLRPSGNAPEMRCYVEAVTETAAKVMMVEGLDLIRSWVAGR